MRTRFAPSPTGNLHIGSLRTALFSYLLAKKHKGSFFLRIEDTDRERHVENAMKHIVEMLEWAGMPPDEGVVLRNREVVQQGEFGPYIQSERLPIYRKHVELLIEKGMAYRCFCSKERLDAMREEQSKRKQAPMYDRTCLSIPREESENRAKNEPHVIRFHIQRGEKIRCEDLIRGMVEFKTDTIDDQVILKSDGFPTYHLAHVVDDHLMQTDLVIRGEEWLPSLPKHLLLFRAFGWEPPDYAHVPLLLAKGGGKLSKRQGDVSVEAFIEKGYLKEAIINFIALLGWNPGTTRPAVSGTGQRPGTTQELFTMEELIELFSLDRVQKAGAIFDIEKLDWMQGQWIRKMQPSDFANKVQPVVAAKLNKAGQDKNFAEKAALIQERMRFFSEAPAMMSFFYEEPEVTVELLANDKQKVKREDLPRILEILISTLANLNEWHQEAIQSALFDVIEMNNMKRGQLLWPLRAALTGQEFSPGAFEVAAVLGKEETMRRLLKVSQLM